MDAPLLFFIPDLYYLGQKEEEVEEEEESEEDDDDQELPDPFSPVSKSAKPTSAKTSNEVILPSVTELLTHMSVGFFSFVGFEWEDFLTE